MNNRKIIYKNKSKDIINELNKMYYYDGNDLGNVYTKDKTSFRLWAPTASKVSLNLYRKGNGDNLISSTQMKKDVKGTWIRTVEGDLDKTYYTYTVVVADKENEVVDPYVFTTGVNGKRGMVINFNLYNPPTWNQDICPKFAKETDAIIYELHIRDLSSDPSSGISNVGKFLGLTETKTTNKDGIATGLDHIKELGITHLHLLPVFDYATVAEERLEDKQYNWGYDPQNYNTIEGSYSTNPYEGEVRVKEFKEMIRCLHENGIRVVMDVVYNHTYLSKDSNFNKIVPNYYYRIKDDEFTDGSACGNEIASENKMVRKYIVESVVHWAREYHIDGFRFDLMGLHDIDTMKAVKKALLKVDPSILIYGEGWVGGESSLKESLRASKKNAAKLDGIGVFNDDFRDGIKGNVFDKMDRGFVSGKEGLEDIIRFGIVGATKHRQVKSIKSWAREPKQSINYISAHDDLSLFDKISLSCSRKSKKERIRINKFAASIVLTSQGIPFFQAGEELLRSKKREDGSYDENSYKSSDTINSIKWSKKTENIQVYNYYKGLIELRKSDIFPVMSTTKEIRKNLVFYKKTPRNVIAYTINNIELGNRLCVIHNANEGPITIDLKKGEWNIYVNGMIAGGKVIDVIKNGKITVDGVSTVVLSQFIIN